MILTAPAEPDHGDSDTVIRARTLDDCMAAATAAVVRKFLRLISTWISLIDHPLTVAARSRLPSRARQRAVFAFLYHFQQSFERLASALYLISIRAPIVSLQRHRAFVSYRAAAPRTGP